MLRLNLYETVPVTKIKGNRRPEFWQIFNASTELNCGREWSDSRTSGWNLLIPSRNVSVVSTQYPSKRLFSFRNALSINPTSSATSSSMRIFNALWVIILFLSSPVSTLLLTGSILSLPNKNGWSN